MPQFLFEMVLVEVDNLNKQEEFTSCVASLSSITVSILGEDQDSCNESSYGVWSYLNRLVMSPAKIR